MEKDTVTQRTRPLQSGADRIPSSHQELLHTLEECLTFLRPKNVQFRPQPRSLLARTVFQFINLSLPELEAGIETLLKPTILELYSLVRSTEDQTALASYC